VLVGGDALLIAASAPKTAELLSELGYEPVEVDISEFEKLEGCVTCLSVRLRP
jgi:dimethylargininase